MTNSTPELPPSNNLIRERIDLTRRLKEILEFDVTNGLCIALYDLELRKAPPDESPFDDTLSRLERLANPQKPKYQRKLIGACYRLDLAGDEFLIILTDGTVMKIKAPDNESKPGVRRYFEEGFSNLQSIEREDFYRRVTITPASVLGRHGTVVYNTNNPSLNPENPTATEEMVRKDWQRAQEIKKRLIEIRNANKLAGLRAITSLSSTESEKTPPSS